jgi:hypothetical protein
VKLLLEALRDVVLSPITLGAAALDLLLSRRQAPRYFHQVMRVAERSDRWIDPWSSGREARDADHANVDQLLQRVEEMVNDPQVGARRARILRRWAERQVARARRKLELEIERRTPPTPPTPRP